MFRIFIEVLFVVWAIGWIKNYIESEKTTTEHDTEWDDDIWR